MTDNRSLYWYRLETKRSEDIFITVAGLDRHENLAPIIPVRREDFFELQARLVYNVSAPQKAIRLGDSTQNSQTSVLSNSMAGGVDRDEK